MVLTSLEVVCGRNRTSRAKRALALGVQSHPIGFPSCLSLLNRTFPPHVTSVLWHHDLAPDSSKEPDPLALYGTSDTMIVPAWAWGSTLRFSDTMIFPAFSPTLRSSKATTSDTMIFLKLIATLATLSPWIVIFRR